MDGLALRESAGSFVLSSFFAEKMVAGGGTGVELLFDLGEGAIGKVIGKQREQGTPHEGEIREGLGMAGAGAILAPDRVTAPVVADFHPGPVPLDERQPLGRSVRGGFGAGQVVADFVGGDGRAFHRPGAAHHDQGAGAREVGGERFDRERVDPAGDNAAVAGISEEKKGVAVCVLQASA